MRRIAATVVAFFGLCVPVSAANVVTTGTTCTGSVGCSYFPAKLAAFDSSLGELTNIVLKVDVGTQSALTAYFLNDEYPPPMQTGSARLSYSAPFVVTVNGVTYSVNLTGDQFYSYTGFYSPGWQSGPFFLASGSNSFEIDRSLYSSFIGGTAGCGPGGSLGICGSTFSQPPYPGGPGFTVSDVNNIKFGTYDTTGTIAFTLTYVFRPVPEPSTWAMTLLGFAVIGLAIRSKSNLVSIGRANA